MRYVFFPLIKFNPTPNCGPNFLSISFMHMFTSFIQQTFIRHLLGIKCSSESWKVYKEVQSASKSHWLFLLSKFRVWLLTILHGYALGQLTTILCPDYCKSLLTVLPASSALATSQSLLDREVWVMPFKTEVSWCHFSISNHLRGESKTLHDLAFFSL